MAGKKRKRREERPTIHPNNKYSDKPPDFSLLASLYPSFEPFVFYSRNALPRIDWTDFNATRELTRVLLLHDHGLKWWIPDGQLCPTVPNRSNYIHWIGDLLSSDVIPKAVSNGDNSVKGFDIGTGANCIYPLLGASLFGWRFVGSDVTDVALKWAEKNVKDNPHVSELIEIRRSESEEESADQGYFGPPILLSVVREDEEFDFCMCNPPFFETMEESGLNPKTSCGGTHQEMVCPGGEKAFITRIIEDSIVLRQKFRWYTSMVGRKTNLKSLVSKLWEVGVLIVKTTEFVQGQTSRWGLAWSFVPPIKKIISIHVAQKSNISFMLEGLQRQYSAVNVLQSIETFFSTSGASCNLNMCSFTVEVTASRDQCNIILKSDEQHCDRTIVCQDMKEKSTSSSDLCIRISVYQQNPGSLLVKSSLKHGDSQNSGNFLAIMKRLEEVLKQKFCRESVHLLK